MRIAYDVFIGLLLKYLYKRYRVVPLQVAEGMASLWAPDCPLEPASALPSDPSELWQEFQDSDLASEALADGIDAMLSAVGNIGGIALTDRLARGPVLIRLVEILRRYERKFQAQGGMRLDFYLKQDIAEWKKQLNVAPAGDHTTEEVWAEALASGDAETSGRTIATKLVDQAVGEPSPTMRFRSTLALWRGEGIGPKRTRGWKDDLGWKPTTAWRESSAEGNAEETDKAVESALAKLDRRRRGACDLDLWAARQMSANREFQNTLRCIQEISKVSRVRLRPAHVIDRLTSKLVRAFQGEALVPLINPTQIKAALQTSLANLIAWTLARRVNAANIAAFGWPLAALKSVPEDQRFALRFIKKSDPPGATTLLKLPPLGSVVLLPEVKASLSAPFSLRRLASTADPVVEVSPLPSAGRCIVCGSGTDLLQGAKSFLPESKKRWYEAPTTFVEPKLCGTCAFVAYLSAIYPNDDTTIVEFPTDNFLELFALHEHLQGVSGLVALKVINRTASLSVFPSRYVLLSKSAKRGQMDSKTQVYMQLRNHQPLLRRLDRPMRVQVEGSQPNFWSEIYPHVAVGLSYFAHLAPYYETGGRKITAQRMTRALTEGRPFAALYLATQARQPEKGFGFERDILPRGVRNFEREFLGNELYAAKMARAFGGPNMDCSFYNDVIDLSNYLLDLVRPLVAREVGKSRSGVSGVARKYTDLIARDFAECRAAKFLYVVCQEADAAERDPQDSARWVKWHSLRKLYGGAPKTEGKSAEDAAKLWSEFRELHTKTVLEERIAELHAKHGQDQGLWMKFLTEVEARTLALLMLNVRNVIAQ
jgi:hypothetical protein